MVFDYQVAIGPAERITTLYVFSGICRYIFVRVSRVIRGYVIALLDRTVQTAMPAQQPPSAGQPQSQTTWQSSLLPLYINVTLPFSSYCDPYRKGSPDPTLSFSSWAGPVRGGGSNGNGEVRQLAARLQQLQRTSCPLSLPQDRSVSNKACRIDRQAVLTSAIVLDFEIAHK